MVKVAIKSQGTIGKVSVSSNPRTTIADPKFKPKPNVALVELADTTVANLQDGDVVAYDSEQEKFTNKKLGDVVVQISSIQGGTF